MEITIVGDFQENGDSEQPFEAQGGALVRISSSRKNPLFFFFQMNRADTMRPPIT